MNEHETYLKNFLHFNNMTGKRHAIATNGSLAFMLRNQKMKLLLPDILAT